MSNDSISSQLLFAQNAITNAQDHPTIKDALAEFGYDDATLNAGKAYYEEALRLDALQKKEYGDQYHATDDLNSTRAKANKVYMKDLKLARIQLRGDRNTAASLQLDGDRKRSLPGWISQAKTFYTNALDSPAVLAAMAKVGRTQEKLEEGKSLVADVEKKRNIQLKEMGEAQSATEARDHALDELSEWMGKFVPIAKIALEDKPQLLEMLGLVTE